MKWTPRLAVDLGTSTVLIEALGQGVVLNQPSVLAVQRKSGKVLAVGQEAADLIGRTPASLEVIRPLREGVISDFEATEVLLKRCLEQIPRRGLAKWLKPAVIVCMPSKITAVEQRAIESACQAVGMGRIALIREPIAAALGAGLAIDQPKGQFVVDIGAGTTDLSVISLFEPVIEATLRVAGDVFNEAIIRHLKRQFHFEVGELTAERLKRQYGCALSPYERLEPDKRLEPAQTCEGQSPEYEEGNEPRGEAVQGRDSRTGLPTQLYVDEGMLYEALQEPLSHILEGIRTVLEQTPPDLLADLVEEGITLTGGGAMLRDLAPCVERFTGLKTRLAEAPLFCVVKGTAKAFDHLEALVG